MLEKDRENLRRQFTGRARLRRQTEVKIVEEEVSDDDSVPGEPDTDIGELDDDSEDEDDELPAGPAQPTPAPGLVEGITATERVIPTLTPISHSPAPPGSEIFASMRRDREKAEDGTTLATSTITSSSNGAPGRAEGAQRTSGSEFPSATSGYKGFLESGEPAADVDVIDNSLGEGGINAGARAGIALGSIAGAALLAGLLILLWKWYRSRRERDLPESHLDSTAPGASPALGPAATIDLRSNSQILDDLIAASYAHQNGGTLPAGGVPAYMAATVSDEKRRSSASSSSSSSFSASPKAHNDAQPQIRFSIASWLRRHHPLKLNPLASARGSWFSTAGSRSPTGTTTTSSGISTWMRRGSGSTSNRDTTLPSDSISQRNTVITNATNNYSVYDFYVAGPGTGTGRRNSDAIPAPVPVPPLPAYAAKPQASKFISIWSETTASSSSSGPDSRQGALVSQAPESVVTASSSSSSGNTSALWIYGPPSGTGGDMTDGQGTSRQDELVSPLSPAVVGLGLDGAGLSPSPGKRGSSPVLPPGY